MKEHISEDDKYERTINFGGTALGRTIRFKIIFASFFVLLFMKILRVL